MGVPAKKTRIFKTSKLGTVSQKRDICVDDAILQILSASCGLPQVLRANPPILAQLVSHKFGSFTGLFEVVFAVQSHLRLIATPLAYVWGG